MKVAVALIVTVVAVVLLAGYDTEPPGPLAAGPPPPRPAVIAEPTGKSTVRRRPRGRVRSADGVALTTPFSVIQVRVTMTGGRLTGIETLALSGNDAHTQALNARAEPILREEALRAGSARGVDTVSGATSTSESYLESLQSAIDRARR